jgi:hypothetical protein
MELAPRPTGEPTAKGGARSPRERSTLLPAPAAGPREPCQVLERDRRVGTGGGLDESLGEGVQPRFDPVVLPSTILPQELPRQPSVVRHPSLKIAASLGVEALHHPDLRKRSLNGAGFGGGDRDPIAGTFVRVERQEGSRLERLGDGLLEEEHDSRLRNMELLDSNVGASEDVPVMRGNPDEERAPLPEPKGVANLPRPAVEVERQPVRPQEWPSDVRNFREDPATKSNPVRFREREGDLGGDDGVLAGELVDERPVAGESGHGTAGGLAGEKRFAKDLVDEHPVVPKDGEEGRRKSPQEGESEGANNGGHPRTRRGVPEKDGRAGGT